MLAAVIVTSWYTVTVTVYQLFVCSAVIHLCANRICTKFFALRCRVMHRKYGLILDLMRMHKNDSCFITATAPALLNVAAIAAKNWPSAAATANLTRAVTALRRVEIEEKAPQTKYVQ